jgi:predicted nucleotidyltransferase
MDRNLAGMIRPATSAAQALEACIRRELPLLDPVEHADLTRIIETLVMSFRPLRVYVFGSQARGTADWHSDVDLMIVVRDAGSYPHHLAQEAYRSIGHSLLPLELMFVSQEEFEWRSEVVTSLPATVLREGRVLYDATAA